MAQPGDYEQKAREAEELAAMSRHHAFKTAFEKIARDYRALAQSARQTSPPASASDAADAARG